MPIWGTGILLGLLFLFALPTFASCPNEHIVPNEYIIRVRPNEASSNFNKVNKVDSLDRYVQSIRLLNPNADTKDILSLTKQKAVTKKARPLSYFVEANTHSMAKIEALDSVLSVEPNCLIFETQLASELLQPNDPQGKDSYALKSTRLPEAWFLRSEATDVIVAVIDTGVDIAHPDLIDNIWVNQAEYLGAEGIDDDSNGYVDDVYGFDFSEQDSVPTPGDWRGAEHGTHVSGIIGARGDNGVGIAGVTWNTQLMPLKVFADQNSRATLADIIAAIYYAVDNGADVINISLTAQKEVSDIEQDAYDYAEEAGVVVVVASGNNTADARSYSPARISSVIAVGSINSNNQLSSFSNYGPRIDLLAPGGETDPQSAETIVSTFPIKAGSYGELTGTSMAAPYVTGTVALLKGIEPSLTPNKVKDLLQRAAKNVEVRNRALFDRKEKYQKLDIRRSLELLLSEYPDCNEKWCKSSSPRPSTNAELPAMGSTGCSLKNQELPLNSRASGNIFILLLLPLLLRLIRTRRN